MRTTVTDDDGSEWSIEITEGDRVNASTKPVKQTPPTRGSCTGLNEIRPFFLNDFPTDVVSRTQSTGQETTKRTLSVSTPMTNYVNFETDLKSRTFPTMHTREATPLDNYQHEQVRFQQKHRFDKSHEHRQPTRITPLTSSAQTSSSKVNEGEPSLPVYSFMQYDNAPAVVYTKSESEADSLVQTLKGPLGFDLEWRVMWHAGAQERRTALVQLCDHQTILLIQVSSMKRFPRKVLDVIESADIVKTGANILNDGEKLYRDFGIRAKRLVELGAFATKADAQFSSVYNREIVSLAKMVAMYLGKTLLKGKVRISNWEAHLSPTMVEYAANDCHCALMVYNRLQEIADRDGKTLDVSMYSCQVTPRSLEQNNAVRSTLLQSVHRPTRPPVPHYCIPEPPRPQQLRAYKLWHVDKMPLDQICMKLRTGGRVEPLKESTVISYIVGALQADPRLPFDMDNLKALVLMEASSWQRHRQWIASRE